MRKSVALIGCPSGILRPATATLSAASMWSAYLMNAWATPISSTTPTLQVKLRMPPNPLMQWRDCPNVRKGAAGMARAQEHPAHSALYRVGPRSVQGFLAVRAGLRVRLMVARFVVLAALIVVAGI